jgi:hypothetical protein
MKEIVKRLEKAIAESNRIDSEYEKNPESAELEKAFDDAYKAEYEIRKELANAIIKFTKEIDFDTAFKMTYNPKTIELIKLAENA